MAAVDFITALGRVLHDGAARDAFAADAPAYVRQIGLSEVDSGPFLRLVPTDLEFQARVLLRKRFNLVRPALSKSCAALGREAWTEFEIYGRANPAMGRDPVAEDARRFAQHLLRERPDAVCPIELNRCRFACLERRLTVHVVAPGRGSLMPILQVIVRQDAFRWQEWLVYFKF